MALREAERAYEQKEIPVGAVVVHKGMLVGRGHNMVEQLNDPTAHAEMLAITAACEFLNSKYLVDCSLFVTIEPCVMCAGALAWSQVSKVVFGAYDPNHGFSRHEGGWAAARDLHLQVMSLHVVTELRSLVQ